MESEILVNGSDWNLFLLGCAVGSLGAARQIEEGRPAAEIETEGRLLVDTLARMVSRDADGRAAQMATLRDLVREVECDKPMRSGPWRPRTGPKRASPIEDPKG